GDVERRGAAEAELTRTGESSVPHVTAPRRCDNPLVRRTVMAERVHAQGDLGCVKQPEAALRGGLSPARNGDRRSARVVPEHRVVGKTRARRRDLARQVDEVPALGGVLATAQRQPPERPALPRAHVDRARAGTGLAVVSRGTDDRVAEGDGFGRPGEDGWEMDRIETRHGRARPTRGRARGQSDSPDDTCDDPGRSPRERPDAWSAHGIPPGRDHSDGTRPTTTRG